MQTWLITVTIVVVALVVLGAVGAWLWSRRRRRRSERLAERFGPEYDATVASSEDRATAERDLEAREKRVRRLEIVELSPTQRTDYAEEWRAVQARFVDDPADAITLADRRVQEVMDVRGYPTADFEQRAADISVDHPQVVAEYRAAHAIAARYATDGAATEELRQALVHYRALFSELLGAAAGEPELAQGGTK
jgi:FtsZ-interacting cell division protein ZipA